MLQPDKLKKLNENASKMAQAGKSKEDIIAMKDAFIKQFGSEEPVKKKVGTTSTSITPDPKLVSEKKVGSSGTPKTVDDLLALKPKSQTDKSAELQNFKAQKNTPSITPKEINRKDIAIPTKRERVVIEEGKVFEREQKMKEAEKFKATISQYENDRQLSDEEKAEKIKEKQDEIDGTGFINTISDYGKKAWNAIAPIAGVITNQSTLSQNAFETDVLAEDKQEFVKNHEKNGGKAIDLTPDAIKKGATDLFINKALKKAQEDKETLLIENMDEDVKKKLEINKGLEYGTLKDKDLLYTVRAESSKKRIEDLNATISTILKKHKNKETLTPEEVDFAKNYEAKTKEEQSNWEKNQADYFNNQKQLLPVEQEYKMLKKSYEDGLNLTNKFLLNSARIGLGFAQFEERISSTILGDTEDGIEYRNDLAQRQADIDKIKETEFANQTEGWNGIQDAFKYTTNVIGEQLPNMLMMSVTGGSAIPMIGASSAGNKFGELTQSNNEGKTNYTTTQILANGLATGFANMLETQTLKNVMQFKRFVKAGSASPSTREMLKDSYKETSKKILKGIGGENAEELGAFFIEDFADETFLGVKKTSSQKKEQIIRLLKDTTTFSALLQGIPHVISSVTKPFASKTYTETLDKQTKEIVRLTKELQNANLSETDRKIIEGALEKTTKESSDLINNFVKSTVNLSDESKNKIIELEDKSSKTRVEAEEINKSKTISKETKQKLLNDLKNEYVKSEELRNKIIEGKTNVLDVVSEDKKEEMKSNSLKVLVSEKEGSNEAQFTNDVIEQKAIELYNNQIQSKDAKTETNVTEAQPQTEVQEPTNAQQEEITPDQNVVSPEDENQEKENAPKNEVVNEAQEERNIDANGYVPVGDNPEVQQQERQADIGDLPEANNGRGNEKKDEVKPFKPTQARVKSIKGGSYIVDFDENKNVTKIVSAKTGKEIKKFKEVPFTDEFGRKSVKVDLNTNYVAIESDALGIKPISTLKAERKNKLKNALTRVEPVDSETAVAEFLASGGKVSYEDVENGKSAKSMTGLSRKEVQWAINDNARSLEDVATQIASEYGLDSQDVSNELSRMITSRTKEQVEDFIIDQVEFNNPAQEDINNALNQLSEEQRAEFEAMLANEEFLKGLSPIDQAIYFGEKLNEQEQFNIKENGTSTKEPKQAEAVVGEPKNEAVQGLDDNGKSPSDSPNEALQEEVVAEEEVKKTKLDEIFNQDNIQDGLDWLDNLMLDPNDLKVTLPFLPQTWNAFIEAIKIAYKAGNTMSKAIHEGIKALEALGVSSTEIDSIVNYFNSQNTKTPPKTKKRKPIDKNKIKEGSFEDLVMKLPKTGNRKQSEGAETITKLTEDIVVGDTTYDEIGLLDTFAHSNNYINVAIEQFGDQFVSKVLDYIENNQLEPNEIAFAYVALENKLRQFLDTNPKDLTFKKQLDLVRKKRIAYMTTIGQAMNAPKLQNLAYYGYDTSEVTDMMFTSKEKNDRKELSKSVEVDIEEIQKQEETADEFEEEIDEIDSLLRGKRKADVKAQKQEIAKDIDKIKEDVRKKLLALKNKGLRSSFDGGITEKLIAISPEILKLAKLYAKSTKLSTKEIIDSIYDDFKDVVDGLKKKDIIDVLQKDLQKETNKKPKAEKSEDEILQDKLDRRTKQLEDRLAELKENKPKDNSGKSTVWNEEISGLQNQIKSLKDLQKETNKKPNYLAIVKKALIDAGFGKDITVNTKNGKEQRTIFDWKKLVGEELSLDNIKKNVEETLLSQGYTQEQIDAISTDLQNQYNNLHADIINKKANEINRRNKKNYNTARNNAYRLAELYNLGLFEDQRNQFDNIFNSLLGTSKLDQDTFDTLTEMAQGLAKIQKEDIGFFGKKLEKDIIDKINKIVHKYKLKKAPLKFKVADLMDKFLGISTRMILHSMGQVVSNTFSGFSAVVRQGIFNKLSGNNSSKKYSSRTNKIANATAIDIALNSGSDYGDIDANLSRNSTVEDFLNGKTDNKTAHGLVSAFFGKIHLNMADSYFKSIITNGKIYQALMLVATDKSNKNRMTKKEARNYITKQLTGENWDNAIAKSIEIVEKVNADNNIVSNKKENIARIAEGMVLSNLLENNVFSEETIESAYKASYTSAGFDLGHESNNLITTGVNKVSIELSKRYEKALQEEKYDSATSDLIIKSFFSNFFKTFVGGGTNWAILTAQITGIDFISLYKNNQLSKDNKIELDSDEGLKNLTEAIKRKLNARSTNTRMAIGAVISTAMLMAYLGNDEEDEENKMKKTKNWLNENKWAKPYFSYVAPSSLAILVNAGEKGGKDATKETLKILGIKDPNFEDNAKIAKAIKLAYTGKTEQALVEMNKFIGSKANVPLPWRTFRDIEKVYRGINGLEEIKPNYKTKDPTNALFVGGFAEWIGLINTKNGGKPEKEEPSKYSKF